jgi:hypothetical protein
MYGFGDVQQKHILNETSELMEDMVLEYIDNITTQALNLSQKRGKLALPDFLYIIRNDQKKYNRAYELLQNEKKIKEVRKIDFEELGKLNN